MLFYFLPPVPCQNSQELTVITGSESEWMVKGAEYWIQVSADAAR